MSYRTYSFTRPGLIGETYPFWVAKTWSYTWGGGSYKLVGVLLVSTNVDQMLPFFLYIYRSSTAIDPIDPT
jgi:hypothetical protein